jgi:hypothetical protein
VRRVLDTLEGRIPKERIDLIIATSMISHGVDIDALNYLVFQGMPRNTAEYIQALSRVGRRHPAIIFVVFNMTRERDQSYYKYFKKFHEFRDMLIEAVPLSRWAKFSIERTLPGIFCGSLLNFFDIKCRDSNFRTINTSSNFKSAYSQNIFTQDEIIDFVNQSYAIDTDPLGYYFKQLIQSKIPNFITEITNTRENKFIGQSIPSSPMRSLRDIEETIMIRPTLESFGLMKNIAETARTRITEAGEKKEGEEDDGERKDTDTF